MPSSRPTIAELRAVCQPPALVGRRSAEHWAGRAYMRRVSLHVTRRLVDAPVTPNGLTGLMIAVGLVAAAVAAVPAWWAAVLAVLGVQAYLLLDCVDGEVARWRRTTSAAGVYLDRLGHYVVEAALVTGIGIRADGGYGDIGGWTVAGLAAAVLVLLAKAETDLVVVARVGANLPTDVERESLPGQPTLRGLRRVAGAVPLHRLTGAVELSLLLVVAAGVDALAGGLAASRALAITVVALASVTVVGHAVGVLTSQRLR